MCGSVKVICLFSENEKNICLFQNNKLFLLRVKQIKKTYMTTGTITIRGSVYQGAQRYAKEHNVSLNTFVESIIVKAIGLDMPKRVKKNKFKLKSFDELSPRVRSLIGPGNASKEVEEDINGRNARMEYLEEKYGK